LNTQLKSYDTRTFHHTNPTSTHQIDQYGTHLGRGTIPTVALRTRKLMTSNTHRQSDKSGIKRLLARRMPEDENQRDREDGEQEHNRQ